MQLKIMGMHQERHLVFTFKSAKAPNPLPVIKNAAGGGGNFSDNSVHRQCNSADANLNVPEDSSKTNLNNNSKSTSAIIESKIHKQSIVVGVNGNQIPSKMAAEPMAAEQEESHKLCEICNVRKFDI